jgi:hypothetical protein
VRFVNATCWATAGTHTDRHRQPTAHTLTTSVVVCAGEGRPSLNAYCCCLPSCLLSAQVSVAEASASNPGIPPSSLMSFLRVKPSIQGVVLTEFDSAFRNPFYASRFDNGSSADAGIAATAAVLAAALHRLAGGDPQQLQVRRQGRAAHPVCVRPVSPRQGIFPVYDLPWPLNLSGLHVHTLLPAGASYSCVLLLGVFCRLACLLLDMLTAGSVSLAARTCRST